jgi:hypothetical protein
MENTGPTEHQGEGIQQGGGSQLPEVIPDLIVEDGQRYVFQPHGITSKYPANKLYKELKKDFEAGKCAWTGLLQPVLKPDDFKRDCLICKLECRQCGALLSASNPGRSNTEHGKACRALKRQRVEGAATTPAVAPTTVKLCATCCATAS